MARQIDLDAVLTEIAPLCKARAKDLDDGDTFAAEAFAALRERCVFSALVPLELGGGGARHAEMCAFLRALARSCPSTALALSMHQHLVAAAVANDKAGRPGRKLLERVAAGNPVLVSTGASDWLMSNGNAIRGEGGWRVSAVKPFASGSPAGDILVTSAACRDHPDGASVLHFPVPMSAPGVAVGDDWQAMGMRGTGSNCIRLTDVFVPDEAVVLTRPQGPFHPAFAVIVTVAMPLIMSVYLGAAEAGAAIVRERLSGGQGVDDTAAGLVGAMETQLTTAELACDDMVRLAADYAFTPTAELASTVLMRKTIAARHVIAAMDTALDAMGGGGFLRQAGFERIYRDVLGAKFHPLPEARQQLFTGRLALGRDPVRSDADIAA